jgi:hypothetical protein
MKVLITFFFRIGNTTRIASCIAKGTKPHVKRCDLVPVKEANPESRIPMTCFKGSGRGNILKWNGNHLKYTLNMGLYRHF